MKAKIGKIVLKAVFMLFVLGVIIVPAAIVWSSWPQDSPVVDAMLDDEAEYDIAEETDDPGIRQTGSFSYCYGRYYTGKGFYLCNDWYVPEENYDPEGPCNAVNMFFWTDTGANPDVYWRVVLHPDETCTLWRKVNTPSGEWEQISTSGGDWEVASEKNESYNDPDVSHPIWELKIPHDYCTDNIIVGAFDPKRANQGDCPPTDQEVVLGPNNEVPLTVNEDYGSAPSYDSGDYPNWGCPKN